jgi:transposase
MISPEKRQRVQALYKAGHGIRWIARQLKLSRNTVREILDPSLTKRRQRKKEATRQDDPPKGSPLEPYKGRVQDLVEEDELLREKKRSHKPLTTTHILKDIRGLGYQGGRTILDDYVRQLRGPRRRSRKPFRRFETCPAEEGQQDWSPYQLEIAGKSVRVELFSLILCWSRLQFLRAYLDQKRPTLLWGHAAAFRYMGGVPWRIVYDRQTTITPFDIDGRPIIHEKFQDFADHYGFEISICNRGDKERKGKVEKPFAYFESSFLPRRRFESLEDLNRQIQDWLDGVEFPQEGNHRVHGTTNEVPYERWLEEKPLLLELPETDLLPRRIEKRVVEKDCTISVLGTKYTVPARLVESGVRDVWVSIAEEDFVVHDPKGEVVARHRIERDKKLVIDEEHYKGIRRRKRSLHRGELEEEFLKRFSGAEQFLRGLKATLRSIAPIHLREILALARRYRREEVEEALEGALRDGTTTAGYVRQTLERKHPTARIGEIVTERPKGLALGAVDPGSAEGYGAIFEGAGGGEDVDEVNDKSTEVKQ